MTKILLRSDFPLIDFALNVKKKKQTPVRSSGLKTVWSRREEAYILDSLYSWFWQLSCRPVLWARSMCWTHAYSNVDGQLTGLYAMRQQQLQCVLCCSRGSWHVYCGFRHKVPESCEVRNRHKSITPDVLCVVLDEGLLQTKLSSPTIAMLRCTFALSQAMCQKLLK